MWWRVENVKEVVSGILDDPFVEICTKTTIYINDFMHSVLFEDSFDPLVDV